MTKNKDAPTDVAAVVEDAGQVAETDVAPAQELTLLEFCQRLSSVDKRVELIGAFHYAETTAGTVKDLEAAFNSRFVVFLNKPV